MTTQRLFLVLAAAAGALAVILGAFGAHALRSRLPADRLATFETGVRYQMYHAFALIAVAWLMQKYPDSSVHLAGCLRRQRVKRHWTQVELAERLETSQSRVAKMEAGDKTVTLDLLVQALFRIGASRRQVASALGRGARRAA